MIEWVKILETPIKLTTQTLVTPTKGNLVYEYNPLRNYRLTKSMYEYNGNLWTKEELQSLFNITLSDDNKTWNGYTNDEPVLRESGELVDFITDELSFDLTHPVNIIPLYSYDGSVNLILNDGINTPKLINTRFSATGRNTYEVVDRKGNHDTNIYDLGEAFETDTSLYKLVSKIAKIKFDGESSGGNLKVGNYFFYFKLSDDDGNETDFIGESGLVSVFIGTNDSHSITSGQKNENSFKNVKFILSNLDISYNYVTVYYSRATAEGTENSITEYKKIDRKFAVNNAGICTCVITGYEPTIDISVTDINSRYELVDAAKTQATCLNMLFLGNIHKPEIPYEELQDLSLRFLPYLHEETYKLDMDYVYNITSTEKGYYDPKFIYEKTGYWADEFYRFGIVYIMPNGELSPVFNIRGGLNIEPFGNAVNHDGDSAYDGQFQYYPVYNSNGERNKIPYIETTNLLIPNDGTTSYVVNENNKGVVKFSASKDTNTIYGVDIRVSKEVIEELKKYVKGYFFVRQPRIPTILALGITVGIDNASHTPVVPTLGGILEELSDSLEKTHVTTEDINDVNYVSEGFLTRYSFGFKKKSSSLWKKIGKTVAITAAVAALAVATVYTGGAALVAAGTIAATSLAAGGAVTTAVAYTAIAAGVASGVAVAGVASAAAIQETRYAIQRTWAVKKLDGRNTKTPSGYSIKESSESRLVGGEFEDRLIIKDSSSAKVQGIICPDYELNLPYYNQVFTGNTHKIKLTNSLSINALSKYSSNYFSNDGRHFYIPNYYDMNISNSYDFKVIGVQDGSPLVGLDDNKFRGRAGNAEEAWRYECIGDDYKIVNGKKLSEEDDNDSDFIDNKKINSDIVRGNYGAYLAFNDTENKFSPAETVNIYIPNYSESNISEYMNVRMLDESQSFAISDRIDILDNSDYQVDTATSIVNSTTEHGYSYVLYRGDCYICQYTHRLNRNFNAPSSPYNDEIVDEDTWKDNYDPSAVDKYADINTGDVDAVQLGMWLTFRVRSSRNLNIRTLDGSDVDEATMTGHPHGYYPYLPMTTEGSYKTKESEVFNNGFNKKLGDRWNMNLLDVPYIKNWFGTRIIYSDIHINDAYTNGFRIFRDGHHRDYTREYGEIVKLIPMESSLLCIFEHGVAMIPVNERAVAAEGSGGLAYINTSNVLPENPKIISDMYGSQWPDSILKVPGRTGDDPQYVYGVDTVAKKIWRTNGTTLECISDFKVQEFLNNNITLGERENTPILGIRNVKTCYNAYKQDVMFTFYDNTYGFEEKVWNLCWNELLKTFVTFYSWVPSFMENINNVPFSFDRNVSKWVAKLGTSHSDNSFADGITLTNTLINNDGEVDNNSTFTYQYLSTQGKLVTAEGTIPEGKKSNLIGILSLSNRTVPSETLPYVIKYSLENDPWGNYKLFSIDEVTTVTPTATAEDPSTTTPKFVQEIPIYGLYYTGTNIKELFSELYYRNNKGHSYSDTSANKVGPDTTFSDTYMSYPIFKDLSGKRLMLPKDEQINADKIVRLLMIKASIQIEDNDTIDKTAAYYNMKSSYESDTTLIDAGQYCSTVAIAPKWNMQFMSFDFWKHGQAGIIDIADDIYPTYWYGKQHPFEFEFIVNDNPNLHKIFTNMEIIANKAKPESFHYEVVGEAYDFAKDKPNMYFRQEALKALWLYNGCDITYNRNFLKVQTSKNVKSADLIHTYYERQDTVNEIEDYYISHTSDNHDYRHLSGGEIVYYPNRQEFRIQNHVKAVDIADLSQETGRSLIAANMQYLEDKWLVQINPLLVCYKNESTWAKDYAGTSYLPPLAVMNSLIPDFVVASGTINYPSGAADSYTESNALYHLYNADYTNVFDFTKWIGDNAQHRHETDIRDRFVKIKIRYSGEDLAVIDWINTIYQVSYA